MGNLFSSKEIHQANAKNAMMKQQIDQLNHELAASNRAMNSMNAANTSMNSMNSTNTSMNSMNAANASMNKNTMRNQMNSDVMSNSANIPVTSPKGIYDRPGYSANDPYHHYDHICDKCKMVQIKRNHENPFDISTMNVNHNAPQPFDSGNYLSKNKHVCSDGGVARQCQLTPM
jgi:hypothetical protein